MHSWHNYKLFHFDCREPLRTQHQVHHGPSVLPPQHQPRLPPYSHAGYKERSPGGLHERPQQRQPLTKPNNSCAVSGCRWCSQFLNLAFPAKPAYLVKKNTLFQMEPQLYVGDSISGLLGVFLASTIAASMMQLMMLGQWSAIHLNMGKAVCRRNRVVLPTIKVIKWDFSSWRAWDFDPSFGALFITGGFNDNNSTLGTEVSLDYGRTFLSRRALPKAIYAGCAVIINSTLAFHIGGISGNHKTRVACCFGNNIL